MPIPRELLLVALGVFAPSSPDSGEGIDESSSGGGVVGGDCPLKKRFGADSTAHTWAASVPLRPLVHIGFFAHGVAITNSSEL